MLPAEKRKIHAPWVTCAEEGQKPVASRTVRTPVLTSPDGRHRAYAEIQAIEKMNECGNTVRLFVGDRGSPMHMAFEQGPADGEDAVSLAPVSWSPNSRWLLVERGSWSYGSDAGGIDPVLYDAQSGKVLEPDVLREVERVMGKHCGLDYNEMLGFDAQNCVRLHLFDSKNEEGQGTHCITGGGAWLFDPATQTARAVGQ